MTGCRRTEPAADTLDGCPSLCLDPGVSSPTASRKHSRSAGLTLNETERLHAHLGAAGHNGYEESPPADGTVEDTGERDVTR